RERVRPGIFRPAAPALEVIFGNVGDLPEAGKRMYEANRLGDAQAFQPGRKPPGRLDGGVAMEGHRGFADIFDLVEDVLAILLADSVSEQRAKHPHDGRVFSELMVQHATATQRIRAGAVSCMRRPPST